MFLTNDSEAWVHEFFNVFFDLKIHFALKPVLKWKRLCIESHKITEIETRKNCEIFEC